MKRKLSLLLCAALVLASLAGCKPSASENDSSSSASGDISSGGSSSGDSSQEIPGPSDIPEINFMVLSGPTGVGALIWWTATLPAAPPQTPHLL